MRLLDQNRTEISGESAFIAQLRQGLEGLVKEGLRQLVMLAIAVDVAPDPAEWIAAIRLSPRTNRFYFLAEVPK